MILTDYMINNGKTDNGGYTRSQLIILGALDQDTPLCEIKKGWKKRLVGKEISQEQYSAFIKAKNVISKKGKFLNRKKTEPVLLPQKINKPKINFVPVKGNLSWQEQYLHPNWQKLRMIIFVRDNFRCKRCRNNQSQLHVHHLGYDKNKFIWELPLDKYITLCEDCHDLMHGKKHH